MNCTFFVHSGNINNLQAKMPNITGIYTHISPQIVDNFQEMI